MSNKKRPKFVMKREPDPPLRRQLTDTIYMDGKSLEETLLLARRRGWNLKETYFNCEADYRDRHEAHYWSYNYPEDDPTLEKRQKEYEQKLKEYHKWIVSEETQNELKRREEAKLKRKQNRINKKKEDLQERLKKLEEQS